LTGGVISSGVPTTSTSSPGVNSVTGELVVVVAATVVVGAIEDEVVDVDPIRGDVVVVEVPAELAG
jgi:hypothetical protein